MTPSIYQEKYKLALKKRNKKIIINSVISLFSVVTLGIFVYFNLNFLYGAAGGLVLFSPILLDLLTVDRPNPLHFFPLVKLKDKVIYNPNTKHGKKYKISYEHAMMNDPIPRWEVAAVGENTFVIKNGEEMKEIHFSRQDDIFIVPDRTDALPQQLTLEPEALVFKNGMYIPAAEIKNHDLLAEHVSIIKPIPVVVHSPATSGPSMEDELL